MDNKTIPQRAKRTIRGGVIDKSSLHFSVPETKLGHVTCVSCKHKFYTPVTEKSLLTGHSVPLLLPCGHPICVKCVKTKSITCPLCNKDVNNDDGKKLPLNLYTLGLIFASGHRPVKSNDQDFGFNQSLAVRLHQIKNKGHCYECDGPATVKCVECMVLYCSCCCAKIHGRALQNHQQMPIVRDKDDKFISITNNCSPKCQETLSYFCNDCDVAGCSNCMLCLHKMHDYMTLQEKNEDLHTDFQKINQQVLKHLQRTNQTKQKVKSILYSLDEVDHNESVVEASIARHFAYLHGILQNTEAKLIAQLHMWQGYVKDNLTKIETQLQTQEQKLAVALMMGSYANENFARVDIRNAIKVLKEVVDLPCYLVHDNKHDNEEITFCTDDSIVTMMENHCTLKTPPMSRYALVRTDDLPKDYVVEALKNDSFSIPSMSKASSAVPKAITKSSNVTSTSSTAVTLARKLKDKPQNGSVLEVDVIHIVDPSLFFVRPVTSKAEFCKFEDDLKTYGDNCGTNPLIAIEKNDLCIVKHVQDQKWYRARVKKMEKIGNETLYDILYIDYGYEERNVPTSRMQSVIGHFLHLPPQLIQCSLYGTTSHRWTSECVNKFKQLIEEAGNPIRMCLIKSLDYKLCVDIMIPSLNGSTSLCKTILLINFAHAKISQDTALPIKITYVYNKEELVLNKMMAVSVEHVVSPNKIYVVKKGQRNTKLRKLLAELNEYYKNDTLETETIDMLMKGLPCAAPRLDDLWSRGEIVEILDDNQVEVFYVDIGYSLILHRDKLRSIPYNYTVYNAQAIRISLKYIMPEFDGNWKPEAIEVLKSIFESKPVTQICSREKLYDTYLGCIIINNNQDVSRLLKQKGVVNIPVYSDKLSKKTVRKNKIVPSKKLENSITNLSYSFEETANDNKSFEKDEATKDPFKMEVRIQQVITPDCIYVAQMDFEKSNEKLIPAIQMFYDTYYSEPQDNWSEGAVCIAYSAKDKLYLRAKILKIKSPTEVTVYLYDMGLEEMVTLKDIQNLHPKFAKEPTYCFKVKLAGILPCGGSSVWPSLSCMTLLDIIEENGRCKFYITKLVEEVCDDAIPVELWIKLTKIPGPLAPSRTEINSINRILVDKGVALPIKDYFSKANSVLATVFKEQLENNHQLASISEKVQWFNKITCLTTTICEIDNDKMTSQEKHLMDNNLGVPQLKDKHDCSRQLLNWLPPCEIVEEVFHAVPTYVDDNCIVYLHSVKHSADILQYIESELQIHFSSAKIEVETNWKENDLCIAQYHHNKKWYRGKVKKNLGNTLLVEFVDYGNTEECEIEYVTKNVKLEYIPIQCTRCVISGLKPATVHGKWMLHDLDRIHALLVDNKCEVCILQRQPTQLVISITLFQPRKCKLLPFLTNLDMNIKIEPKEWNDLENSEAEDLKSENTQSVVIDEKNSFEEPCVVDISDKSFSESQTLAVTFQENVISGCSMNHSKSLDDSNETDFGNTSWTNVMDLNNYIVSSTPHNESEEENVISEYKVLTIPQETKYIELILCCNRSPTISHAQLAENNDTMFSDVLHDYYMKYKTIISDLQTNAFSQPLIESFEKNTPCVAKFSDDNWYRCVIIHSKQVANTSNKDVMLYYIDYGNNEYKRINIENHDLRTPKRDWLELPAMAIECQFSGIEFVSDDIDLLAQELDKIYNRVVVAQIKEIRKALLVTEIYKDKECQELLYAHLINKGLYKFKEI